MGDKGLRGVTKDYRNFFLGRTFPDNFFLVNFAFIVYRGLFSNENVIKYFFRVYFA